MRALSHSANQPVDLLLSPAYSSEGFRGLLTRQSYLGDVSVAEDWTIVESAPITPRVPPTLPEEYDLVVHLAYEGWPSLSLPWEIYGIAEKQAPLSWPIDLDAPWIAPPPYNLPSYQLAVGFTDEHFELKYGLYWLLRNHALRDAAAEERKIVNVCSSPRWTANGYSESGWEVTAAWISRAQVFVGCCSALHVLACAIGTPAIVVEPAPARHHDIFYPYGKLGPQVQLVTGTDGLPTVDSRHLIDAVTERLAALGAEAEAQGTAP